MTRAGPWCAGLLAGALLCAGGSAGAQRVEPTWRVAPSSAAAEPVSYRMEVELLPASHHLRGRMAVRWTNTSTVAVDRLLWHLYLNAFRDPRSVFQREAPGGLRGQPFGAPGRVEVRSLRTADGADLLAAARRELVAGDLTQLETPLPRPAAPGETLELQVELDATLPGLSARTGWARDLLVVAQWFPKLARLDPDGTWRSFPFHANAEFYADFGSYDVEVTAPAGYVVAGTGAPAGRRDVGRGRVAHRLRAAHVHDFAFVASPSLRSHRTHAGDVEIEVLAYPGYEDAAAYVGQLVAFGMPWLSRRFGPYPYPRLTVLLPPVGAEGAAGMEYPTFFVSGGGWLPVRAVPLLHAHVTLHELAHQWFQGLIATDEARWPMLDEGITEWATGAMLASLHGEACSAIHMRSFCLSMTAVHRFAAFGALPSLLPAHDYPPSAYGASVYFQPSLVLETARRVWGAERFDAALRSYARRGRFAHPTPELLFEAFARTHGTAFVEGFLRPALADGATAGWAVGRTVTWPIGSDGARWRSEVDVRRTGELAVPVTLELRYRGGGRSRVRVDPARVWSRVVREGANALVSAEVDPERRVVMDASTLDDARASDQAPTVVPTLLLRLTALAQALLATVGP